MRSISEIRWKQLRLSCWMLCLSAAFPFFGSAQTTIHVPADIPTIQGAINTAQNGDTVLVAPGTYAENIDFKGKSITVTSGAASYIQAASTVISPAAGRPAVTFQTGEPSSAVLNGFTIQNEHGTAAGMMAAAILILGTASPTVRNNSITNNQGTGITIQNLSQTSGPITGDASPLVQGNEISGTTANPHSGGGTPIYIFGGGDVQLVSNVIENNNFGLVSNPNISGFVFYMVDSRYNLSLLMRGNIIRNNTASPYASVRTDSVNNIILVQNLVYENTNGAENGSDSDFFVGGGHLLEINNTLYKSFGNAFPTGSNSSTPYAVIENNLFINTSNLLGIA